MPRASHSRSYAVHSAPLIAFAIVALSLGHFTPLSLFAQGTPVPVVHGVVSDARSGQPVGDALITAIIAHSTSVDTLQALSHPDGSFTLRPRAAGSATATLRVRRLGFAPTTTRVDVRAHASSETAARIALTPLALQLDATVITAARREQRLKDAVVPIEMIARAEIERSGATDVASVLTEQLGVQLEGGLPAGAGVQLQGLGTNRVLILLDGQPLIGRINGNLDLSRLPTANLERIEVIKGPQSTLYGSDAMGGVINLVTRRASGDRTDASLQMIGGSRGRMDLSGSLLSGTDRIRGGVDVGIRSLQLAPGISGDAGTFAQRQEVSPQLRVQLSDTWRIESSALLIGEQQRYRTGQLFRFADRDQQSARVGAHWQQGARRAGVLLYRSRFDHLARSSTLDAPQSDAGERDRQELTELELTWSGPLAGTIVDAGLELRREAIVADRIDSLRRSFNAAEPFAQVTIGGGALTVTPGVRLTWNEQWGNYATPRVAALWRPVNALSVRATVGRGFRAPDFKEMYLSFANAQAGYAVQGNVMLRPETSTSAQLNIEYAADRVYVRASGFENRLRDFIEFVEAETAGLYTYGNVASARTRGIEVETGFTSGRVRVESGVAYLDARDALTTRVLLGRPRWSGRLSASAGQLLGARLSATLLYTGDTPLQRDPFGSVTSTQPGFTRVDMRAARSVGAGVDLSIGVDNLANRQLGAGWPGFTGRQWYGGLTWTPNPAAAAR